MLILRTLRRREMHGYGIAQHLRQMSDEVLRIEEGSLYPADRAGLVVTGRHQRAENVRAERRAAERRVPFRYRVAALLADAVELSQSIGRQPCRSRSQSNRAATSTHTILIQRRISAPGTSGRPEGDGSRPKAFNLAVGL